MPPLLFVLDTLDQIESSGGAAPRLEDVRVQIRHWLGQFDVRGPDAEQFELARKALVFWCDELLINSPWAFASEWRNDPLEREIYGTRNRAWKFFECASFARGLARSDALEVFALCVANGFQGVYRGEGLLYEPRESAALVEKQVAGDDVSSATLTQAPEHDSARVISRLPPTLDEWSAAVFVSFLEERIEQFTSSAPCDSTRNARPLAGAQTLARWVGILVVTVAVTAVLVAMRGW